jgi:hypothetical protein
MVGKTKPMTVRDKRRMDTIAKHCGCLPCLLMGWPDVQTSIEHVTNRGRRMEDQHQWTIGLCAWHHFGEGGLEMAVGPSLALGRRVFEEHFGDELKVLVPTQDFMLSLFDEDPWPEYAVPRNVSRAVRTHWISLNARPSRYTVRS